MIRTGLPSVVVNRSSASDFKILNFMCGDRFGIIEGRIKTVALQTILCITVDDGGQGSLCDIQCGGQYVYDMRILVPHTAFFPDPLRIKNDQRVMGSAFSSGISFPLP